jgi:Ca2+-transporting ATPase
MRRPPRPPEEPLFSRSLIAWSLLQGALVFLLVAAIFLTAIWRALPETEVRAAAFFALVLTIISLIFVNRSFSTSLLVALRRRNRALAVVLVTVAAMLSLTLVWPFARGLFRFGPLRMDDLALIAGASVLALILLEILKPLWRERQRSRRRS